MEAQNNDGFSNIDYSILDGKEYSDENLSMAMELYWMKYHKALPALGHEVRSGYFYYMAIKALHRGYPLTDDEIDEGCANPAEIFREAAKAAGYDVYGEDDEGGEGDERDEMFINKEDVAGAGEDK